MKQIKGDKKKSSKKIQTIKIQNEEKMSKNC